MTTNDRLWQRNNVARYANRNLKPVETLLIANYTRIIRTGRVLEVGCGAGRFLGYLSQLGNDVWGIDFNTAMLEECEKRYPNAKVMFGDLRAITHPIDCDIIFVPFNTIDVLTPEKRDDVLTRLRGMLKNESSRLIFSSHNRDAGYPCPEPIKNMTRRAVRDWLPSSVLNRRRFQPKEIFSEEYPVFNDSEGGWASMHVYVSRKVQEKRLNEIGFENIACVDDDGHILYPGEVSRCPSLHYIAQRGMR